MAPDRKHTTPLNIFLMPNPFIPLCMTPRRMNSSPIVTTCQAMALKKNKVHNPCHSGVRQEYGTNNMTAQNLPTSQDVDLEEGTNSQQLTPSPIHVSQSDFIPSDMDDEPNAQSPPIFSSQIENLNPPYPPSFSPPNISPNTNLSPKPEQKVELNNNLPQISAHSQPPILTQHQPLHIISKIPTKILNPQLPQITQVEPNNPIPHLKRKVSQK